MEELLRNTIKSEKLEMKNSKLSNQSRVLKNLWAKQGFISEIENRHNLKTMIQWCFEGKEKIYDKEISIRASSKKG